MSDEMVAGPALDRWIAVGMFGLVPCSAEMHTGETGGPLCYALPESPARGGDLRAYSTDIAAAWLVVEKMRERFFWLILTDCAGFGWLAVFNEEGPPIDDEPLRRGEGEADFAPLAICRAALQAVATPDSAVSPGGHHASEAM